MSRQLKPEYQELADDYAVLLDERGGCTCWQLPPCSLCTHEGHPESLENTPEAWEELEDE